MNHMDIGITPQKRSGNPFRFFLWWQIDEEELVKQATEYETLKFYQTARGISAILLLLSAVVTILFILMANGEATGYIDVFLFVFLALFVALKQRWAMVLAMGLWSIEKIVGLFMGGASSIFVSLLWWALYMHYFYLAFKVEGLHREMIQNGLPSQLSPSVQPTRVISPPSQPPSPQSPIVQQPQPK